MRHEGKILVVASGTESLKWHRMDMMAEFRRAGYEVVALGEGSEEEWEGFFEAAGIRYTQVPMSANGTNPVQDLRTLLFLRRFYSAEKPDKVFTFAAKPNIYGCLAARGRRDVEVYSMVAGLGNVVAGDSLKDRLVQAVFLAEYRVALKRAKRVFFQNDDDARRCVDRRIATAGQVARVNGSGVNLDHFARRPLPEGVGFLFSGRLLESKGVLDYCRAAEVVKGAHPEVTFTVVGPFHSNPTALKAGDLRPYVESGVITYEGPQDDVRPFLEKCSAFVLPSYYGEGTPKGCLEAMAVGRAVITTDSVGCREVVRDGGNGFLVPPRDPEAIAEAMIRLIDDPALAARMGEESRRMAEELFDVRKVNDVICETMGINR
ncbi:glycosyltransferase family 4 protein [Adlercreutzia sp. ZJ473]|uniref:glycosyltransferase family 4 protein n=1 Tax=Adlercreutzia sp. ZJ473 TaxID=2722822 RepID=UPI0015581C7C